MNKQFAATITDTHITEAEAKNKSTLGSALLSSPTRCLCVAEVLTFQAQSLPCWLQYTFFSTSC